MNREHLTLCYFYNRGRIKEFLLGNIHQSNILFLTMQNKKESWGLAMVNQDHSVNPNCVGCNSKGNKKTGQICLSIFPHHKNSEGVSF